MKQVGSPPRMKAISNWNIGLFSLVGRANRWTTLLRHDDDAGKIIFG